MSNVSVWIDAAAVVVMPCDMADTAVNDVLQSVLLAQLVANKRVQVAPERDWHDSYVNVLSDYWMSNFKSRQALPLGRVDSVSPLQWVRLALANLRGESEQMMQGLLQDVSRLSGDLPAINILRKHAQPAIDHEPTGKQSNAVRLLVIQISNKGSMSSLCLQFETTQPVDANPWGQRFETAQLCGPVSVRCFQAYLSETLFAPARAAVTHKLEAVLDDNIAQITGMLKLEASEADV